MKNHSKDEKKKKPLALRIILWVLLGILVVALAIGGYYLIRLNGMTDNSVQVTEPPADIKTPEPEPSLEPVESPDDLDVDYDDPLDGGVYEESIYKVDTIDENVVNILVLGEDTREGESGGRSDTMMVLSYNKKTGAAKLVSVLRDTYVPIAGHGTWNRVNTAYRFGGVGMAINTINQNFGLDIQYYISTDFQNMQEIVDMLGGLELTLTKKEAAYINNVTGTSDIPEADGTYTLNGAQVLAHSRNRKMGDGDWGRTRRQRDVMLAFFNRAKQERDVASLLSLLNGITEHVKTNMSLGTMLDLGQAAVFSNNFTLQGGHIPFDKTWNYARVNGASVIKADLDENKELILEFLYEK